MDQILQDERIIELRNATGNIGHLDKTLFDHLYGTYKILKQMNKPEYVCMAGFFHSVYETEYFEFKTIYNRDKVKTLIGTQAEELVNEFCKLTPRINQLISKSEPWSDRVYADLLDIELANMKEQGYYNESIKMLEAIRKNLKVHMDYTIYNNLLPKSYSDVILQEFEGEVPWFYTPSASGVYGNFDTEDKNIRNSIQFVHSIAEDNEPTSNYYSLIIPIVWFFEQGSGHRVKRVLRIKVNCLTRDGDDKKYQPPHVDVAGPGYVSLIYYINDSDGDTVIFNEYHTHGHNNLTEQGRITPKQGSMVMIPSDLFHSSSCPIHSPRRMVVNIILELE